MLNQFKHPAESVRGEKYSLPISEASFKLWIAAASETSAKCLLVRVSQAANNHVSSKDAFEEAKNSMTYTAKNAQLAAILFITGLNNVVLPTLFIVVNNIDNIVKPEIDRNQVKQC